MAHPLAFRIHCSYVNSVWMWVYLQHNEHFHICSAYQLQCELSNCNLYNGGHSDCVCIYRNMRSDVLLKSLHYKIAMSAFESSLHENDIFSLSFIHLFLLMKCLVQCFHGILYSFSLTARLLTQPCNWRSVVNFLFLVIVMTAAMRESYESFLPCVMNRLHLLYYMTTSNHFLHRTKNVFVWVTMWRFKKCNFEQL